MRLTIALAFVPLAVAVIHADARATGLRASSVAVRRVAGPARFAVGGRAPRANGGRNHPAALVHAEQHVRGLAGGAHVLRLRHRTGRHGAAGDHHQRPAGHRHDAGRDGRGRGPAPADAPARRSDRAARAGNAAVRDRRDGRPGSHDQRDRRADHDDRAARDARDDAGPGRSARLEPASRREGRREGDRHHRRAAARALFALSRAPGRARRRRRRACELHGPQRLHRLRPDAARLQRRRPRPPRPAAVPLRRGRGRVLPRAGDARPDPGRQQRAAARSGVRARHLGQHERRQDDAGEGGAAGRAAGPPADRLVCAGHVQRCGTNVPVGRQRRRQRGQRRRRRRLRRRPAGRGRHQHLRRPQDGAGRAAARRRGTPATSCS